MNHQPQTVAEAYLQALKSRGVDWIFGNAGTDFAPIIEALAVNDAEGASPSMPRTVEVLHETVAVAMANGYYLMTGKPQCAMVHVNVGAANTLMGIINACRGNVPMLFASGRTPITEKGRLGSRNVPIHWGQEMFDQGGMMREFVKWDNELRAGEQVVDQVDRALAISQAEPKGPVYLSLPREILAEGLPPDFEFETGGVPIPTDPHPAPAAITEAVAVLAEANHPLIVTSDGGEALFSVLGPFAERFAVPVVQFWRTSAAISTDHPMYAGEIPAAQLARADAVIVLDSLVPWMPSRMEVRPDTKVIHIGPDPLFAGVPTRTFPADLVITSTPAVAMSEIGAGLHGAGYADNPNTAHRRASLAAELADRRSAEIDAGRDPGEALVSPQFLGRTISDAIGEHGTVVNELGLDTSVMDFTHAHSYFGPAISGGLGWGGGAAIGAKLAEPERRVVWTTGDGSYVFSNPAAVHHAAASLGLGLLTVVADNRVWNAVRRATISVYPEGAAAQASDSMALSSLEPAPDYPKFVEAYGGYGVHVETPDQLRPALDKAIDVTESGRQALVSVHVSHPDTAL